MKIFINVMMKTFLSVAGDNLNTRRRARLHWFKAYTLIKNPNLVLDSMQRKLKDEKDKRFAMNAVVSNLSICLNPTSQSINLVTKMS